MSHSQGASSSIIYVALVKHSFWYLDLACCNHIALDSTSCTIQTHTFHMPINHIASGSTMTIIGIVSTTQLSISNVCLIFIQFLICWSTLWASASHKIFFYWLCCTESSDSIDHWDKTLSWMSFSSYIFTRSCLCYVHSHSITSLELWYSRLGHASLYWVQTLVSKGMLD